MMRLVNANGLSTMLIRIADAIEQDFLRWEAFDKTPRVASHSDVGVIELMPTSDGDLYGFKYVNGHPKNTAEGLQTVTAFGLLADVNSGYPVLLSEMTLLTALRTAAMSALAAKHLASPAGGDDDGHDRPTGAPNRNPMSRVSGNLRHHPYSPVRTLERCGRQINERKEP
ncbi:UNVERIFIED_CONTAM: hypothetical protein GTU68_007546 [Idotea baltica]|nr:hypothetical protein [Idotea baltica]